MLERQPSQGSPLTRSPLLRGPHRPARSAYLALFLCVACRAKPDPGATPEHTTRFNPTTPVKSPERPTNRLAKETSPYLLQHQHNPVDWYPWGAEAFERARTLDRPVFLSVGYSACHWCHVMEHESFEDPAIAELLNQHFVAIKVDREERPDVDELYMKAVSAMTGRGGWPMSVFLTPAGEPFFGGTYFPPEPRYGMPGFVQILTAIGQRWEQDQGALVQQGQRLAEALRSEAAVGLDGHLDAGILERAASQMLENFDFEWGGFGEAPKFPHTLDLRLGMRLWSSAGPSSALAPQRSELERGLRVTLEKLAAGGIHDQLDGGFHRYSTDREWKIPHFEKMLYDNALLIPAYLDAGLCFGEPAYLEVARNCADWAIGVMQTPSGGFASSLDADSDGAEGRFYSWTPEELETVLGPEDGRLAARFWDVTPEGNFEAGRSALWRREPLAEVAEGLALEPAQLLKRIPPLRAKLLSARQKRIAPSLDDKVLSGWNGLMLSALAQAHQVLGETRYLDAAQRTAKFLVEQMSDEQGRLMTSWRLGRASHLAGLQDHALVIQGLLDLFESDFDPSWLERARSLAAAVEARFQDAERGGYFDTPEDGEPLLARLRTAIDGALPSGSAVQISNLLRLAALTGEQSYRLRADQTLDSLAGLANRHPEAFSQLLIAEDSRRFGLREVVISGEATDPDTRALLAAARGTYRPQKVVLLASAMARGELVEGRRRRPGQPAQAFVCLQGACQLPVSEPADLIRELAGP